MSADRALLDEKIILAIDRYRRATGADLREAKRAIDERALQIGVVWKRRRRIWVTLILEPALTAAVFLFIRWVARH
jgi:hypothetical protein